VAPAQRPRVIAMKWYATNHHQDSHGKRRAIAWGCTTNFRIAVRHRGHPTATYPYFVCLDGVEMVRELGTFATLAAAQLAAMVAFDRRTEGRTDER
jgi:hypothetical protein